MVINAVFPRDSVWKRRLLCVVYIPACVISLIIGFWYVDNPLFLVFSILFFLFTLRRKYRARVLPVFLAVALFLPVAGTLYVSLGPAGDIIAAGLCILTAYWLIRVKILSQAPDSLVHYCLIGALLTVWFYFIPAPYPSAWILSQKGVSNVASLDTSAGFRKDMEFRQTNFVDEYSPGLLLVGAKRYLFHQGYLGYYLLIDDKPGYALHEAGLSGDFPAIELLRCGGSGPVSQRKDKIFLGEERLLFVDPELSPPNTGFCSEKAHVLVFGDECSLYAFDVEQRKMLLQEHAKLFFNGIMSYLIAPYGGGKLVYLKNKKHPIIGGRSPDGQTFSWKPAGYQVRAYWGEDKLVGNEDLDYVLSFRMLGFVSKIEPETGRKIQSAQIWPGMRFATMNMKMRLVFSVNEWLGIIEVLDLDSLKRVDVVFVGQRARKLNFSRDQRGLGYMVSSVGVFKIDFCQRLPDRCQ